MYTVYLRDSLSQGSYYMREKSGKKFLKVRELSKNFEKCQGIFEI